MLATDIDVTFLQEADGLPCEIARHDIGADPAPRGAFGLVHARLLLEHVPGRDAALNTMTLALRPGGWLLVESGDPRLQPLACPDEAGPAQELANRLRNACWAPRPAAPTSATGAPFPAVSAVQALPRSEPKPVSPSPAPPRPGFSGPWSNGRGTA